MNGRQQTHSVILIEYVPSSYIETVVLVSVESPPHHSHRESPVRFFGVLFGALFGALFGVLFGVLFGILQGMDGRELVVTHPKGHVIAVANRVRRQALHR